MIRTRPRSVNKASFVIDTDQYPAEFERELIAYCTGLYAWDDFHGVEEADLFYADHDMADYGPDRQEYSPFARFIDRRHDNKLGTLRPGGLYQTTVFFTDGNKNAREQDAADDVFKYPATHSIVIYLTRLPENQTDEGLLARIRQRAVKFVSGLVKPRTKNGERPKILGFRLFSEQTIIAEVDSWENQS